MRESVIVWVEFGGDVGSRDGCYRGGVGGEEGEWREGDICRGAWLNEAATSGGSPACGRRR